MQPYILAVLPLVVTGLTTLIKRIPVIDSVSGGWRYTLIRFIAALLSFGGVLATYMVSGVSVDPTSIQTVVLTFMAFLGSVGGHEMLKQK